MDVHDPWKWRPSWSDEEDAFQPRTAEVSLYAACLLVHGTGPKFKHELGSNQQQLDDAMAWGKTIDEWWIGNVYSVRDWDVRSKKVSEQAYEFRRRFLNWCRENNDGHEGS